MVFFLKMSGAVRFTAPAIHSLAGSEFPRVLSRFRNIGPQFDRGDDGFCDYVREVFPQGITEITEEANSRAKQHNP